jgi:hypothetical protein
VRTLARWPRLPVASNALTRALNAESALASSLTESNDSKRRETELTEQRAALEQARDAALAGLASAQATLAEWQAQRALDQQERASADHERARLMGILEALEMLGREIADVGSCRIRSPRANTIASMGPPRVGMSAKTLSP